jgi:CubicO group peptidase (beta-lactamase class C family)
MAKLMTDNPRAATLKVNPGRLLYLDTYLQELTEKGTHDFCAVRVLRHGEEIFDGAYGVMSPGGPPLTGEAIYPMASITKPIVATLLAMLQEDGVIDLWDKFHRYYPAFAGGKKDEVELWQVMAHSSGMSDDQMQEYVVSCARDNGISLPENCNWDDYYSAIMELRQHWGLPKSGNEWRDFEETETDLKLKAPLAADPHTVFSYCNTGYSLLCKLIERLTGEGIEAYAARRLFKPLGMNDSHFILPKDKWTRAVKRDPALHGADWLNSEFILTNTDGAGGLKSTMHDLTLFGQMYLHGGTLDGVRILSPASVRLLTADHNAGLPASYWGGRCLSSSWGLGWNVCYGKKDDMGLLRSDRAFDHAGAGGARLLIDPDNSLVVAMYLVEREEMSYDNQSRVANIIYSALD